MAGHRISKAATGLAAGALLTAALLGAMALGALARIPFVPFVIFEWLFRVLPGSVVTFGLDAVLAVLGGLGLDIKETAKTAEQVLAVGSVFVAGTVVGLVFFVLTRTTKRARIVKYGLLVGGVGGIIALAMTFVDSPLARIGAQMGLAIWALALFLLWGWGLARLYLLAFPVSAALPAAPVSARAEAPPQAEVRAISRRRFVIQMGGLAATLIVVGAGVADVLQAQLSPHAGPVNLPEDFPNADSPVQPAPQTRPEYTPVADHFRVDITLTAPDLDPSGWRLTVDGLVDRPQSLSLDELKTDYVTVEQFVTLECISNIVGGPLIGTTLWTGAPLRDVLAQARPAADARYARMIAADGYEEEIDLETVNADPRILLVYAWDRQPLTRQHGFPLRVFVPDLYGMKQPKWIERITLTADSKPGYWVERGWDPKAQVKTTSVIDTVAVKSLVTRNGQTYVPVGGIAYSGAKGISRVEVQIDDRPWEAAQLRQPLSELTWVIWRYDWPYSEGTHWLTVRAFDGEGRPQETKEVPPSPSAATGLYKEYRTLPPLSR